MYHYISMLMPEADEWSSGTKRFIKSAFQPRQSITELEQSYIILLHNEFSVDIEIWILFF
jgi:hypothetical protein